MATEQTLVSLYVSAQRRQESPRCGDNLVAIVSGRRQYAQYTLSDEVDPLGFLHSRSCRTF